MDNGRKRNRKVRNSKWQIANQKGREKVRSYKWHTSGELARFSQLQRIV
jgi:hypothetical protein